MSYDNRPVVNNTNTGGTGFMGLLAIVFITLKLLGVITWSWWLVLAPLWVPFVVVIAVLFLYVVAIKK